MRIRTYPLIPTSQPCVFPGAEHVLTTEQKGRHLAGLAHALAQPDPTVALFPFREEPKGRQRASLDGLELIGALVAIEVDQLGELRTLCLGRARIIDLSERPYLLAQVQLLPPPQQTDGPAESVAEARLRRLARKLFARARTGGDSAAELLDHFDEQPVEVVYFLASLLNLSSAESLQIMNSDKLLQAQEALERACLRLLREAPREPLRISAAEQANELFTASLKTRVERCGCGPMLLQRLLPEAEQLQQANVSDHGYSERLSRLEATLCYPWKNRRTLWPDLVSARETLDESVLGHDAAKARILDLYAARSINRELPCPLICLAGPPGVGKRTLAAAVARAVNRPLQRIALLPDEPQDELLGGRAGRGPGQIYQAAVRANSREPMLLIETSAPMSERAAEVLLNMVEPGRSELFPDAFLGWPIDTSLILPVLIVHTPSQLPTALRERAVVLEMQSYSKAQKLTLLRQRIWPQELARRGLPASLQLDLACCGWLLSHQSQEPGVLALTRAVQVLADRLASQRLLGKKQLCDPTVEWIASLLNPTSNPEGLREGSAVGIVAHLGLTPEGAQPLEISIAGPCRQPVWLDQPESSGLDQTLALASCVSETHTSARRRRRGWQVSIPPGAISEDQSSSGLPLALALRSIQSDLKISRSLAAVGRLGPGREILPAGGLRERALAAQRAGFRTLLHASRELPAAEIERLREELGEGLELIPVETLERAAEVAFSRSALGTEPRTS